MLNGKYGKATIPSFNNRKVLVTGHTGFKGSWLCHILKGAGADVYGYALDPPTDPSLFEVADVGNGMHSEIGDIRDYDRLYSFISDVRPEIIIHLAAQPLVLYGYEHPRETYETNVMGTVNVLECVRNTDSVKSFLNVTTDKVYKNDEKGGQFAETDPLDGYDPYSNSKSCSELVTHSYKNSFFDKECTISTARAGNVIGGGDFSNDRIVPDCVRAAISGTSIHMRNPDSVRPYQHVLEPLIAYLTIVSEQEKDPSLSGYYNVGPLEEDNVTTGELVELFRDSWGDMKPPTYGSGHRHEAGYLRLNIDSIREKFGFEPRWDIATAVDRTVEWSKIWSSGGDVVECMDNQIREYLGSD
jgi:CDP-glucose 4,6-dehydratase